MHWDGVRELLHEWDIWSNNYNVEYPEKFIHFAKFAPS
jgi:hypothetical protein